MPTKTKARPKRAKPKRRRQPSREDLLARDPWHYRRQDPAFAAVVAVLRRYQPLVMDICDWRPWIFGKASCPKEAKQLAKGRMTQDNWQDCWHDGYLYIEKAPKARGSIWAQRHGSGQIERTASSILSWMGGGDSAEGPLPRYSRASLRPEFTRWRTLPNGAEVWREENKRHRHRSYQAVKEGLLIGSWSTSDHPGSVPVGQIGGDFSLVQGGQHAPCATLGAWLQEVSGRHVKLRKPSEALVTYYRHGYEREVEQERQDHARNVYDDGGHFVRRRRSPKPPKRARGFERMFRDAGYTPRLLGVLDRAVARAEAQAVQAQARELDRLLKQATKDQPQPRRKKCQPKARSRSASPTRRSSRSGSRPPATSGRSRPAQASAKRTRSTPARGAGAASTSSRATARSTGGSSPLKARSPRRTASPSTPTRRSRTTASAATRRTGTPTRTKGKARATASTARTAPARRSNPSPTRRR